MTDLERGIMAGMWIERWMWDLDLTDDEIDQAIEYGIKALLADEAAKNQGHSGDCTNLCHSCLRCAWEFHSESAKKAAKMLVEQSSDRNEP